MKTTTVRYPTDLWERVVKHASQRGQRNAAFIRDATLAEVVRTEAEQRITYEYSGFLAQLHRRVTALERSDERRWS